MAIDVPVIEYSDAAKRLMRSMLRVARAGGDLRSLHHVGVCLAGLDSHVAWQALRELEQSQVVRVERRGRALAMFLIKEIR